MINGQPPLYHQRALLAALKLTGEYKGERGYEFYYVGSDPMLVPFHNIPGRGRTYFRGIRVTSEDVVGSDKTLVSELEREIYK